MTRDDLINVGVGAVADRLARDIPPAYAGVAEVLLREAIRAVLAVVGPKALEMGQAAGSVAVLEMDRRASAGRRPTHRPCRRPR